MTRVTVLMGGWSSEREVSLSSGKAAVAALTAAGYEVAVVDAERNLAHYAIAIAETRPDVVFNALHGRFGEDGRVQSLLDIMGITYTHSGVLASALAMDKPQTKKVLRAVGVRVAEDVMASRHQVLTGALMAPPYVLKPACEGSSVAIHLMLSQADVEALKAEPWPYGDAVMMERFIPGRELTVTVLKDRALAVTEILTDRAFYDYEAKYAKGGSRHVVNPTDLPEGVAEEAQRLALLAHRTLGCRGLTRSDFRLDGSDLYFLEINTQPGLTPTSLAPEQAAAVGIGFPELVTQMVEAAACDA